MRMWILTLLLLGEGPASPPVAHYAFLTMGHRAGEEVLTLGPGGERTCTFEFNDRGRGPKLTTRLQIGAEGVPTQSETSGHDYLKAPVDERFRLEGGKATWSSTSEKGERALSAPAFYVSLSGPPEEAAVLARALLKAPGGRLPLLPEGEARIERVGEREVSAGGRRMALVEYALSGLDFTPTPLWLDPQQELFASVSSWSSLVREGWEEVVPALLEAQESAEAVRAEALARAAARRPSGPVAFKRARLFEAETATMRPDQTVVVSGNRITVVGPDGAVTLPSGTEVIDAAGKTLLPGLWDMHVHVSDVDGPLNLAAGITTVRDLANDIDKVQSLRRRWEAGTAVGPRLVLAGFMDGPGPYAGPTKVLVSTDEEARAAIEKYAGLGYEQIKVYSSIKPELVPGIIKEAHQRGLRVSGHVPAFMTAEQVVKLGFDELQHVNFLFLNFWADTVQDTRTPLRFTAVAEKAGELDLESARVRAFIRLLKEREVVVDPTLNAFEGMFLGRPGVVSPPLEAVADRLPVQIRRGLLNGGLPVPTGGDARYRASFQATLKMVGALYRAGVRLVAGTDALAGFSLHRELELYVEAGLPAPQVLQLATLGAARVMKHDRERGSVAPGKLADLVLVEGDPSVRIGDIRRTVTVMKDGILFDPAVLYGSLGVKP